MQPAASQGGKITRAHAGRPASKEVKERNAKIAKMDRDGHTVDEISARYPKMSKTAIWKVVSRARKPRILTES
jgi:Mor family transcriptional regulator